VSGLLRSLEGKNGYNELIERLGVEQEDENLVLLLKNERKG
jgi:hypothetical protein